MASKVSGLSRNGPQANAFVRLDPILACKEVDCLHLYVRFLFFLYRSNTFVAGKKTVVERCYPKKSNTYPCFNNSQNTERRCGESSQFSSYRDCTFTSKEGGGAGGGGNLPSPYFCLPHNAFKYIYLNKKWTLGRQMNELTLRSSFYDFRGNYMNVTVRTF